MDDKRLFLKKITSNILITPGDLTDFTNLFTEKKYSESDYFIREGELTHSLGFLAKGLMRAYISDSEGKEANLRFINESGFISGSFAKGVPGPMNIQCLKDCVVYVSNWNSISVFLKSHKSVSKLFNDLLADGHFKIMQRLSTYLRNGAKARYELFLKEYPNLINHIPHYYVANYLGITTVQLSRIRQKLAKPDQSADINKC